MINNSKNTPPKCIIQKKKKKNQSKIELPERINEREREREPSPFLEENVRQITKLYKRR